MNLELTVCLMTLMTAVCILPCMTNETIARMLHHIIFEKNTAKLYLLFTCVMES